MRKILAVLILAALITAASGCISSNPKASTEKTVTIGHTKIHYSGDVSPSIAKNLALFLQNEFGFKNNTDVFLTKSEESYIVKITSTYKSSDEIEPATRFYLHLLASRISQDVFNGSPVTVTVITQDSKDLLSTKSKYRYVASGEVRVYYEGTTKEEAQKTADYIVSLVGQNYEWDLILEKDDIYHISALTGATTADQFTDNQKKAYQRLADELAGILGGKVELTVTDVAGNKLMIFEGAGFVNG